MIWLALFAMLIATAVVYPRALLWALVIAGPGWFAALFVIVYFVACGVFSVVTFLVGFVCGAAWQVRQFVTRRPA